MLSKKYQFLIFYGLINISAFSWETSNQKASNFQEVIDNSNIDLIPSPYNKIQIGKTTKSEVEKLIGKANLIEKNKQYYVINKFKYALEIIFNQKNLVSEFTYTFPKNNPKVSLSELAPNIVNRLPASDNNLGQFITVKQGEREVYFDLYDFKIHSIRLKK